MVAGVAFVPARSQLGVHGVVSSPTVVGVWSSACASSNVTISNPACGTLGPSSTFVVDINVTNAPQFNAFEFALFYDPTSISLTSFDVSSGTLFTNPFIAKSYTTPAGVFRLAVANLAGGQLFSGSGTLAHITFQINDLGASPLVLAAVMPDPSPIATGADAHGIDWTRLITSASGRTVPVESPMTTSDGYFRNLVGPGKLPPIASFTSSPATPLNNQSIVFNASASLDPDRDPATPGNGIASYQWDFGDGSLGTAGPIADHKLVSGNFSVILTVIDSDSGFEGMTAHVVTVGKAPVRDIGIESVLLNGQPAVNLSPGESLTIAVTIVDLGTTPEVFNLTISYGPAASPATTLLKTFSNLNILPGPANILILNGTLDTTGLPAGPYVVIVSLTDSVDSNPDNNFVTTTFAIIQRSSPPSLNLSPSSGTVGTAVVVHGTNFPVSGFRQPPLALLISFDDMFIGSTPASNGTFVFAFNIPHAQTGGHLIKAVNLFSGSNVTASFQVIAPPTNIILKVSSGSIYFPGDTANIFVQATENGTLLGQNGLDLRVHLVLPNGTITKLNTVSVSLGLFKAVYKIPSIGPIGTYSVLADATADGSLGGSALRAFEVKLPWLSSQGSKIVGATAIVGAVGLAGVAWRKGYFKRRGEGRSSNSVENSRSSIPSIAYLNQSPATYRPVFRTRRRRANQTPRRERSEHRTFSPNRHYRAPFSLLVCACLLLGILPSAILPSNFSGLSHIGLSSVTTSPVLGIDCGYGASTPGQPFPSPITTKDGNNILDSACQWAGDVDGDGAFDPLVSDNPSLAIAGSGGGFTADIILTNTSTRINGFDITIDYDTRVLNAVIVDQSGLLFGGNSGCIVPGCTLTTALAINPIIGEVRVAQALLGTQGGPGSNCDNFVNPNCNSPNQELFRIRFDVVGSGTGFISFSSDPIKNTIISPDLIPPSVPHTSLNGVLSTNSLYNVINSQPMGLGLNVSWTFSPTPEIPGTPLTFTAAASCSNCTGTFNYHWDLSSVDSPNYVPKIDGSGATLTLTIPPPIAFRVTLNVSDSATPAHNWALAVRLLPLAANASGSTQLTQGTAAGSWNAMWLGGIVTGSSGYSGLWKFCPGSSSVTTVCNNPKVIVTQNPFPGPITQTSKISGLVFNFAGIYNDSFQVSDTAVSQIGPASATVTKYFQVNVTGTTPAYSVTATPTPQVQTVGQPISIALTTSYTASYPLSFRAGSFSYVITFGDGTNQTVQGSLSPPPVTHTYTSAGTFQVRVVARETSASALSMIMESTTSTVSVNSPQPLTGDFIYTPNSPTLGQPITFTAAAAGGSHSYSFGWDFGDGSTGTGSLATHAYSAGGNFTVKLTINDSAGGSISVSHRVTVSVPPPPTLKLAPDRGALGTKVRVEGSGFATPYFGTTILQISFDDQFLGIAFAHNGLFTFTFDVPHAEPGLHKVKALESTGINATADFQVLPAPPIVEVTISTADIYFQGDTAVVYAVTSQAGIRVSPLSLQLELITPTGLTINLNATSLGPGLFKATFTIPKTGSLGTYVIVARAQASGSVDRFDLTSFEVTPTWLSAHLSLIGGGALAGTLALALVSAGWRRGYFRKTEQD